MIILAHCNMPWYIPLIMVSFMIWCMIGTVYFMDSKDRSRWDEWNLAQKSFVTLICGPLVWVGTVLGTIGKAFIWSFNAIMAILGNCSLEKKQ